MIKTFRDAEIQIEALKDRLAKTAGVTSESLTEAQVNLLIKEYLNRVGYGGTTTIISGSGSTVAKPKPVDVVLSSVVQPKTSWHSETSIELPEDIGTAIGYVVETISYEAVDSTTIKKVYDQTIFLGFRISLSSSATFDAPSENDWFTTRVATFNSNLELSDWVEGSRDQLDYYNVSNEYGDAHWDPAYVTNIQLNPGSVTVTSRIIPPIVSGPYPFTNMIAVKIYAEQEDGTTRDLGDRPYDQTKGSSTYPDNTLVVAMEIETPLTPQKVWFHALAVFENQTKKYKPKIESPAGTILEVDFTEEILAGSQQKPEDATTADWSIVSYQAHDSPNPGRFFQALLDVTIIRGDLYEIYYYQGNTLSTDPQDWKYCGEGFETGERYTWWLEWPKAGAKFWFIIVFCRYSYYTTPAEVNITAVARALDLPAWSPPAACTGFSVTQGSKVKRDGATYSPFTYAFSNSDVNFKWAMIGRVRCTNNQFNVNALTGLAIVVPTDYDAGGYFREPKGWRQNDVKLENATTYYRYCCVPIDWEDQVYWDNAVYYNLTIIGSDGLDAGGIDPATLGAGMFLSSGQLAVNIDANNIVVGSNGKLTVGVVDMFKAANFDTDIFGFSSGIFVQKAIATNLLVTALGLVTQAFQVGGGSNYVYITPTGVSVVGGSNSVNVTATGITMDGNVTTTSGTLSGPSASIADLQVPSTFRAITPSYGGGVQFLGSSFSISYPSNFRSALGLGSAATYNSGDFKSYSYVPSWTEITGKPSSFPTTWSDVSSKPSSFPSTWSDVSSKPTYFSPTSHLHSINTADTYVMDGDGVTAKWVKCVSSSDPNTGYTGGTN